MPLETIPPIGLGTFSNDNRSQWVENVRTALDVGFRHIDTAQVYGNETYVGEAIATADVDREEIFLGTKTVHDDVPPTVEEVPEAIDESLERLGVDYVDILYVHWPSGIYEPEPVLEAYNDAYEAGKTRYVGLSNFTPQLIDEALEYFEAPLLAHQAEYHPYLNQDELLSYLRDRDIWFVAYSPLVKGAVTDDPVLRSIADKHDATPAQITLAWLLSQDNVIAIPKASSRSHMEANLAAQDIALETEDIERIDAIEHERRVIDPDFGPWNWS